VSTIQQLLLPRKGGELMNLKELETKLAALERIVADVPGNLTIHGNAVVGAGGNGVLKVRHIDGKHFQNDAADGLFLNHSTGTPVVVGNPNQNAGVEVNGPLQARSIRVHEDLQMGAARTITGDARLHITGAELLYILNKNGVVIGREWGGTGDLWVQGALRIGSIGVPLAAVQVGTYHVGNSGSRVKAATINFGASFAGTPRVVAVVRGDGRRNIQDTFTVSVTAVSQEDFAANICRVDSGAGGWGQVLELDWIAWE
jgi:hypothetical protein